MDLQGIYMEFISKKPSNEWVQKSALEAMQRLDPTEYIVPIGKTLDLLPANNF
jgi:chromosome partitioning protein